MIPGRDRSATRTAPIRAVAGILVLWPRVHRSQLMPDTMIKADGCVQNLRAFLATAGHRKIAGRAPAITVMIEPIRNVE
jgi:hypothetical protein